MDNDVGNYPYLDKFIYLLKRELGVTTRISTVGFSRHNDELNEMHRRISNNESEGLGGVRLSFTPSITKDGNYGINIYPKTYNRAIAGYIITERFFLNALISYKKSKKMGSLDSFPNASWSDVYGVLDLCKKTAYMYKEIGKLEKYEYIIKDVLPMINAYISVLQEVGYDAALLFDYKFSIDTGIICNLGRAISEFCGLTNKENEPLTPTHERNYGMYNSKMTQEGVAWRLSCDYDNSIVIEKLNMFDTASEKGQVSYRTVFHLEAKTDEIYKMSDLRQKYLIPGQRRNEWNSVLQRIWIFGLFSYIF